MRTVLGIGARATRPAWPWHGATTDGSVLADVVASSMSEHAFGGVVRGRLPGPPRALVPTVRAALAGPGWTAAVATTIGPGLSGTLLVGSSRQGLRRCVGRAVRHQPPGGASRWPDATGARCRVCGLLVSGGHPVAACARSPSRSWNWDRPSTTRRRAYDKVARLLGLGWQAGRSSTGSRPPAIRPRSSSRADDRAHDARTTSPSPAQDRVAPRIETRTGQGAPRVADVAASFRNRRGCADHEGRLPAPTSAWAPAHRGGVAAGSRLRELAAAVPMPHHPARSGRCDADSGRWSWGWRPRCWPTAWRRAR